MKVKVEQLRPNPFRRMDKYPIIYDKVEKLKNSISETSFWDNILARKKNENGHEPVFEIAYGHHRLKAIKDLGIEEVDIPVRELDDETMIKIMANENMEDWEPDTRVINETVRVVRDFLRSSRGTDQIGPKAIKEFLGDNWPLRRVQDAMMSLDEGRYDREAIETFSVPKHSRSFRESINAVNREAENTGREPFIPKEEQRDVAQAVIQRIQSEAETTGREPELTSQDIRREVYNYAKEKAQKSNGESRAQRTAMVADAYWVQVSAELAGIKRRANEITMPLSTMPEKYKQRYRDYVDEICEILGGLIDE